MGLYTTSLTLLAPPEIYYVANYVVCVYANCKLQVSG
jgi:hypothetical protein